MLRSGILPLIQLTDRVTVASRKQFSPARSLYNVKTQWFHFIPLGKSIWCLVEYKWLKTKSLFDYDNFRQQCAVVNDMILKSIETLYNGQIGDCDGDQNLLLKWLTKCYIIMMGHNFHNSHDELVNKFADYFTEKIHSIREQITDTGAVNSIISPTS